MNETEFTPRCLSGAAELEIDFYRDLYELGVWWALLSSYFAGGSVLWHRIGHFIDVQPPTSVGVRAALQNQRRQTPQRLMLNKRRGFFLTHASG